METGDYIIVMKDKEEWTSASSREEMMEKMQWFGLVPVVVAWIIGLFSFFGLGPYADWSFTDGAIMVSATSLIGVSLMLFGRE